MNNPDTQIVQMLARDHREMGLKVRDLQARVMRLEQVCGKLVQDVTGLLQREKEDAERKRLQGGQDVNENSQTETEDGG